MKGRIWRKAAAACLALAIVSGGVPVQPFTDIFSPVAITVSAARNDYYSDDDTLLVPDNCVDYNVKNLEMCDGSGNIFMLSLPEDANCWWEHFGSKDENAFSDHTRSRYDFGGFDSGIAYSWSGLIIPAGTTVEKSVIFAVGDIHLFNTHTFNADGICYGGRGCPFADEHTAETPLFFQKPQSFSENGNIRYEVENAGQLMWLAQNINNGEVNNNINIELVNDISFNMNMNQYNDDDVAWTPISEFSGVFDGKNQTISGLVYNGTEAGGLFNTLNGATVMNLGIENSSFASEAKVASVAATAKEGTTGAEYQWYYSKNGGATWKQRKTNCTSASYKIKATEEMDGYLFRCDVTKNGITETSEAAQIIVQ